MKRPSTYFLITISIFCSFTADAQLPVKVENGRIYINDGTYKPDPKKYNLLTDSLDKKLKITLNDTTGLFYRALLYLTFNDVLAKPYQGTTGALENLTIAKEMTEKAIDLKMKDFKLKVLRAQIYKELAYRFTADESWKYNSIQITERRKLFNVYKTSANKYYDELSRLDKPNAFNYQKLKVNYSYPH